MLSAVTPYDVIVVLVHIGLAGIGVWLLAIDARTHRLPNRIVLPTLAALLALVGVDALVTGRSGPLIGAVIGMLVLGGLYAVLRAASRGGIGGGDVKLAALIGLVLGWHGWQALAVGAASAFVLGALYALALMAFRRANRSTRIAFGPWMIIGAVLGVAVA
ncbi:prepilin peptidase [Microbacterium murale]|uniref:Leader peptidase (Prepilin peptidase)/N-methyltransferase n=1 Tax=Microbacterium murale TaxID=1081040 RepID=A0ABU0P3S7_9MICO|nr:A24 family peptidase [Microbacterium murale]MDQ0641986.1 leader peptidase (prepilin peptidase)/N-methyltransferase [Microbacterium murale]